MSTGIKVFLLWLVVGVVFVLVVSIPFHIQHQNSYLSECILGACVYLIVSCLTLFLGLVASRIFK